MLQLVQLQIRGHDQRLITPVSAVDDRKHLLHVVVQDFLWVTSEIPKCVLMTPDQCVCAHKKNRKTVIDKQFEYNTYIRDFFADNPGRTLDDAIKCWKYKKQLPGHNHYEQTDLAALD